MKSLSIMRVYVCAANQNRASRPKRLRVFINPISGKRKGPAVFAIAKKIFDICSVQVDVLITEYRLAHTSCWETVDAPVSVSLLG